ncbi:MAG: hypothetical protein CML68_04790 [Rhodobacteraceae bacterium]|nr:hypothetical protein [Paracoccaceae bacterium]
MPVTFQILPHRGLVYVRYEGFLSLDETMAAFGAYLQHPDCRPGQKQLIDLAGVTDFERDFAKLFAVQARKLDVFARDGAETLIVYHAPSDLGLAMSKTILMSWEPFEGVVPRIQDTEADALALLGQPETSFRDLLHHADKV